MFQIKLKYYCQSNCRNFSYGSISIGNSITCTWYLAIIPRVIFQSFPKFHEPRSDEWYVENFEISQDGIIVKHHIQVMLLFVYNRSREIFGNAQETFIMLGFEKQTQASAFVTIFSRPNIQPRLSSFVFLFTGLTANLCISFPNISGNFAAMFLKVKT